MEYVSVEEAKSQQGLRLVLTAGVPGPWSEAAKGLFKARNIEYIPVLQVGGGNNEEVVEWTGHRNAPTVMYNDEPPRVTPVDVINLAERLGSGPSLVPSDIDDRVQMFGLINEIAGENRLAWNARVLMFEVMSENMSEEDKASNPMYVTYRFSQGDGEGAAGEIMSILDALTAQLHLQAEAGSRYFIGDQPSALDIYWACFSQMLSAMPADLNPMPDYLRDVWGIMAKSIEKEGYKIDGKLLEHRDYIYSKHLQLPLDF